MPQKITAERILKEIEALSQSERKLLVEQLRQLRSKEIPQDFIDALDDFQKARFVSIEFMAGDLLGRFQSIRRLLGKHFFQIFSTLPLPRAPA